MIRRKWLLGAAAMLCLGVGSAQADPITTLFSTGVDGSGTPTTDPHYTASAGSGPFVLSDADVLSNGWAGNTSTSAWISSALGGQTPPDTIYSTTFDLTGFDPSTAELKAQIVADNGTVVSLNGVQILDDSYDETNSPWVTWASIDITSGFIAGINTLTFVTPNTFPPGDGSPQGPGGLQFDITGFDAAPVPEPATLTMLGFGLVSLVGYGWRRRKQAAVVVG